MKSLLPVLIFVCCFGKSDPICGADPFLGSSSCATSTCHGGVIGNGPAWKHAFSTWIARDPHAGAGLLLRDEDSRRIVLRLVPSAATSQAAFDTVLRQRCISCHATVTPDECSDQGSIADSLLPDSLLAEGISCESCHGHATDWVEPHLNVEWTGPERFDSERGMNDTESVLGRAGTCVRCHVGSRRSDGLVRDMNHDLIAAGHPALRFDLLLYSDNLPKHWELKSEAEQNFRRSAIRVRQVGRAVNLAAASELSAERASDHLVDRNVPWPELADYDCFACHQSLSIDEFRLLPSDNNQSSFLISNGLPLWNSWHTAGQLELRRHPERIRKLSPHPSDPQEFAKVAGIVAKNFRERASQLSDRVPSIEGSLQEILDRRQRRPLVDWHSCAVEYMELDAVVRDLAGVDADRAAKFRETLDSAENLLRFGASESGGAAMHSPSKFDPQDFRSLLMKVGSDDEEATDSGNKTTSPVPTATN